MKPVVQLKERTDLPCPVCSSPMRLRSSRWGWFYGCTRWPECDGTHGAHPDGSPQGTPADEPTKKARIAAHAAFDALWMPVAGRLGRQRSRGRAYRWLALAMEMTAQDCHIGKFDQATCHRAIELCRRASLEDVHGDEARNI